MRALRGFGRLARLWLSTVVGLSAVVGSGTACGDGSGGLPDAAFLIRETVPSAKDVVSGHVVMTMSAALPGVAVQGFDADVRARRAGLPGGAVGTATVGGMTIPFAEIGGRMYVQTTDETYRPAPPLPDGRAMPSPSSIIDPDRGLARLLGALRDPKTEVRERVRGVLAFRVTGTVPRAVVAGVLPGARTDARLSVWFAAKGRHQPVVNTLTIPDTSGKPVTVDVMLSDPNKKVRLPAAG